MAPMLFQLEKVKVAVVPLLFPVISTGKAGPVVAM